MYPHQRLPLVPQQRSGLVESSMFRVVATRARRDLIAEMSALQGSCLGRGGHCWTLEDIVAQPPHAPLSPPRLFLCPSLFVLFSSRHIPGDTMNVAATCEGRGRGLSGSDSERLCKDFTRDQGKSGKFMPDCKFARCECFAGGLCCTLSCPA